MAYIVPLNSIKPDYSFLMGYTTGVPKQWWHGIEGITYIFMGAWADSYIGYKDYAINEHLVEDMFWDIYNMIHTPPDFYSQEYQTYADEGFSKFMREEAEAVKTELDRLPKEHVSPIAATA